MTISLAVRARALGGTMEGSTRAKLADLYARHSEAALRLAYLMTGDKAAAEDVVQDAFVRLYARFQDRKTPDALEAYLRKTVVNLSRDHHRKLKTQRAHLSRAKPDAETSDPQAEAEARLVLQGRLQKLPHRQRAAVVLRFYEDLSEQAVSQVLNCSVPAVKQLTARGLQALRRQEAGELHG